MLGGSLAAAEHRDGSLFDLKKDSADAIGQIITAQVTENKAKAIAKAIYDNIAKKKRPTPAG